MQKKQKEWHQQWSMLSDGERFLFEERIAPVTMEEFRDKTVLECGCGGGQHTRFVAPYANEVVSVDLNTADIARERNQMFSNVSFVEADIAEMDLGRQFDVVFCLGVVHHTDDPDKTVANLLRHAKPGGKLIVWVYSREGNWLFEHGVEPIRKALLRDLDRRAMLRLSQAVCVSMYPPIYTLYQLPLPFLPYYEYFENFRRLSFERNVLNVFDKLNAPQARLIDRTRVSRWFDSAELESRSIRSYKAVSWTAVGTKKPADAVKLKRSA